jgi:hypothetical protein
VFQILYICQEKFGLWARLASRKEELVSCLAFESLIPKHSVLLIMVLRAADVEASYFSN